MRKHTWGIVLSQKEIPDVVRNAFTDIQQPRIWIDGTYLLQLITYDPMTDAQVALTKVAPLSAYGICSLSCSSEEVQEYSRPEKTTEESPEDALNPIVLQIHDSCLPERTISLILRQFPGHLMLEAYPRIKATDEPWFDAIGAVTIEIYDNKLQVQLYDQIGIEKNIAHWRLPDSIGEGSFVLAEDVDGSNSQIDGTEGEEDAE